MNNYHSSLIASHYAIRQVQVLDMADAAASAVDRAIGNVWKQTLSALKVKSGYVQNYYAAMAVLRSMPRVITQSLAASFARVYQRTRQGSAEDLVRALPGWILRQVSPFPAELVDELREAEGGLVEIGSEGIRSHEPARRKRSAEREKAIYKDLIFAAPTPEEVSRVLAPFTRPGNWERIGGDAAKKMPEELAQDLARGISEGKTHRELAKQLLPHFGGQQSRAMRAARTYSMFIAHRARMDADEDLGDMVIGWQVHATRDAKTRPEHAARDGTVYYKKPTGNQKGLDEMPRPPLEADGKMAWNCRCWVSPVLKPLDSIVKDPDKLAKFTNAEAKLVPDPIDYATWFNRATERQKMQAIGARRYNALKPKLQRPVEYQDVIDQATGGLLTVDRLEKETPAQMGQRLLAVERLIRARQQQIREISTFGFEVPKTPPQTPPAAPALPKTITPAPAAPPASVPLPFPGLARVAAQIEAAFALSPRAAANLVSLAELRQAVPDVSIEQFHEAIVFLIRNRGFTGSSLEGRFGATPQELAALLPEPGSSGIGYLSRRRAG